MMYRNEMRELWACKALGDTFFHSGSGEGVGWGGGEIIIEKLGYIKSFNPSLSDINIIEGFVLLFNEEVVDLDDMC